MKLFEFLGFYNYWVFAILLMIGFYARLAGLEIDAHDIYTELHSLCLECR